MKFKKIYLSLLSAPLLYACASEQTLNQNLEQANEKYSMAEKSDGIVNSSPAEMDAAKRALESAKSIDNVKNKALVDHYALLALKNTEIAEQQYQLQKTREAINNASEKRHQLLLKARTQEANQAKSQLHKTQYQLAASEQEAANLAKELSTVKAEKTARGMALTLQDIVFSVNKAELQKGSDRTLKRIAEHLQKYPKRNILVEGFTDSTGEAAYNKSLSKRRAQAVANALSEHGVAKDRINTKGLGEDYPIASNDTAAGRQKNRRVEITIASTDNSEVLDR